MYAWDRSGQQRAYLRPVNPLFFIFNLSFFFCFSFILYSSCFISIFSILLYLHSIFLFLLLLQSIFLVFHLHFISIMLYLYSIFLFLLLGIHSLFLLVHLHCLAILPSLYFIFFFFFLFSSLNLSIASSPLSQHFKYLYSVFLFLLVDIHSFFF
jgi:hypothetical protein